MDDSNKDVSVNENVRLRCEQEGKNKCVPLSGTLAIFRAATV